MPRKVKIHINFIVVNYYNASEKEKVLKDSRKKIGLAMIEVLVGFHIKN